MNDHHFNVQVAIDFCPETAIYLNNMAFWLNKCIANRKNFHENNFWIFNSLPAFAEIFPYWTEKQLRRIIDNCLKYGLIIKNNFNESKYDRTQWYAFTEKAYAYYPYLEEQYQNALKSLNLLISPFGQMDEPERSDQCAHLGRPIPYNNPDNNLTNKPISFLEDQKPIKLTPRQKGTNPRAKGTNPRVVGISVDQMLKNNPHELPKELLEEWKSTRKQPITLRVWNSNNEAMSQLKDKGLSPQRAFEIMLERQWRSVVFSYYRSDLLCLNTTSLNNKQILSQEEKEQRQQQFEAAQDKKHAEQLAKYQENLEKMRKQTKVGSENTVKMSNNIPRLGDLLRGEGKVAGIVRSLNGA